MIPYFRGQDSKAMWKAQSSHLVVMGSSSGVRRATNSAYGLSWDNQKENGNYYSILGLYMVYIVIMEKKMENLKYIGVV